MTRSARSFAALLATALLVGAGAGALALDAPDDATRDGLVQVAGSADGSDAFDWE